MGTGNSDDLAVVQIIFTQPARAGSIAKPLIQNIFNSRVAPAQCIADDDQVRLIMHRFFAVTLVQNDAFAFKQSAHRRIGMLVRSADLVAGTARQNGNTTHKGPTCTQDMNFHYILNLKLKITFQLIRNLRRV